MQFLLYSMKNLPPRLLAKYNDLLTQNLPKEQHAPYNKWLRFYWDFCFTKRGSVPLKYKNRTK